MKQRVQDSFVVVTCGVAYLDNLLSYIILKSHLLFR